MLLRIGLRSIIICRCIKVKQCIPLVTKTTQKQNKQGNKQQQNRRKKKRKKTPRSKEEKKRFIFPIVKIVEQG